MGLGKEFRDFAMRGNVVDMAIGIIIGGAFGKIVSSLVNDVMMPPLGVLMSDADFSKFAVTLKTGADGTPVQLKYGAFISTVIDFIIVAFVIFLVVKGMNAFRRKQEAAPSAPPAPPRQEMLLEEIRDLLKKQK